MGLFFAKVNSETLPIVRLRPNSSFGQGGAAIFPFLTGVLAQKVSHSQLGMDYENKGGPDVGSPTPSVRRQSHAAADRGHAQRHADHVDGVPD